MTMDRVTIMTDTQVLTYRVRFHDAERAADRILLEALWSLNPREPRDRFARLKLNRIRFHLLARIIADGRAERMTGVWS